jgi:hypothetical protein
MVRLVFRPYTQVRRLICTSKPLRTSTRVSSGFVLLRHSSPSFGSQYACSSSTPLQAVGMGLCCAVPGGTDHISGRSSRAFTFITPLGFAPIDSHAYYTSWSVFQDGSDRWSTFTPWITGAADTPANAGQRTEWHATARSRRTLARKPQSKNQLRVVRVPVATSTYPRDR